MNVKVFLTSISGERLWDQDLALPPQLQISLNVNVLDVKRRSETQAEVPFILTVQYVPSVGQFTAKGRAAIEGAKEEFEPLSIGMQKKQLPSFVVQAIGNSVIGELVILSKSLGLPPPLPPIMPQGQPQPKPDARSVI
ncbi:MAG: hypothetical protein JTT11_00700 [Candidatus Brockarchaeota archaeon]|nr:hypothetical protein [Candidatus Brockarchaeota archaeon]